MTKDEALDLALEALGWISRVNAMDYEYQQKAKSTITAIKQARALDKKAENARELGLDYEPVASVQEDWGPGPHEYHSLPPAQPVPVQEPVGWLTQARNLVSVSEFTEAEAKLYGWTPVYITPPAAQPAVQREHITDGRQCWCNPDIDYVDPETGAAVIVHKEPQ